LDHSLGKLIELPIGTPVVRVSIFADRASRPDRVSVLGEPRDGRATLFERRGRGYGPQRAVVETVFLGSANAGELVYAPSHDEDAHGCRIYWLGQVGALR
jgi:hypothetical protein